MYHVSHQGQQFGPYTVEQINQYLTQGAFDAGSHVWDEASNGWIEISQLKGVVLPAAQGQTFKPVAQNLAASQNVRNQPVGSDNVPRKLSAPWTDNLMGMPILLAGLVMLGMAWDNEWNIFYVLLGIGLLIVAVRVSIGSRRCSECNNRITKFDSSCAKCKVTFDNEK